MALPQQFQPRPPERRGLGLTFLGMMNDQPVATGNFVGREQYEIAYAKLHRRVSMLERALLSHVLHKHRPWYKRLWVRIRGLFKGEDK
jgi:hypothetical protein